MKIVILTLALALLAGCVGHRKSAPPPAPASAPTPYTSPLSTPGARFGALPMVVQNTVRSEAGTAEIVDVQKQSAQGMTFYKVSFRDPRIFPPLYVKEDGSVLNPDLSIAVPAPQQAKTALTFSELPANVRKAVQEQSGNAEITGISQETWGEHTVYVISIKDEAHPKLYFLADGGQIFTPK